ncbi:hypothetical protein PTKIN_Ptkin12aG0041800 [Pterospermum kingtungense]
MIDRNSNLLSPIQVRSRDCSLMPLVLGCTFAAGEVGRKRNSSGACLLKEIHSDFSFQRDMRNNRVALFDGIEEGGIRASSSHLSEIDENNNEKAMEGLQDRVSLLKRVRFCTAKFFGILLLCRRWMMCWYLLHSSGGIDIVQRFGGGEWSSLTLLWLLQEEMMEMQKNQRGFQNVSKEVAALLCFCAVV